MSKKRLIEAMRNRLSFHIGRRLLAEANFPKGKTWDDIVDKLADPNVDRVASEPKLTEAYSEALAICDKLVNLYPITQAELAAAHKAAASLASSIPSSPFASAFPLPIGESVLKTLPLNVSVPVSVLEFDSATAVIYCAPQLVQLRESLTAAQLNPVLVGTYAEIVGIKDVYIQSFSSVIIPNFGDHIEVHTDLGQQASRASAVLDQISVRNAFNALVGGGMLKSPVNLFPAINALYLSKEGDVSLLSHTVADGIKHERMRQSKSVRMEPFHRGGKSAVSGNLTPYQIAIRWDLADEPDMAGRPELRLMGDYRMTYVANASLTEAQVNRCGSHSESAFVVSKLIAHI